MRPTLATAALCLLVGTMSQPAAAYFSATHTQINVAATFNGFNPAAPNMDLVGPDLWQGYIDLNNQSSVRFLFSTPDLASQWGENTTTLFSLPLSRTAIASGTDVRLSGTFDTILKFQFNASNLQYKVMDVGLSTTTNSVWINEIHYDNVGADVDEGVEIAGNAGFSLDGYRLRFVRGNGTIYSSLTLSGTMPDQTNGYGTIWFPRSGIQNATSGIALEDNAGRLVQFLSYEGVVTGAEGVVNGRISDPLPVDQEPAPPIGQTLQLTGGGSEYRQFIWSGPVAHTRGAPNIGQLFLPPILPAAVLFENPVTEPMTPDVGEDVLFSIDIVPENNASNIVPYFLFRTNVTSAFSVLELTNQVSNTYTTAGTIPGLAAAGVVEYFVHCLFDGGGTNSPMLYPPEGPLGPARFGVSRIPAAQIWINELNYRPESFGENTNEFIEIAGVAGLDISGMIVQLRDTVGIYERFIVTNGTFLRNDIDGFGFFVIGDANVPNVDVEFTFTYSTAFGGSSLAPRGAIDLLSEWDTTIHTYTYGDPAPTEFGTNVIYLGIDDTFKFQDETISAIGTGGGAFDFTYVNNAPLTPGQANPQQILEGGNTNDLPPGIACPPALFFECLDDVPLPDVDSVIAVGFCGDGSVTVTHLVDELSGGAGCVGDPLIITRIFQAVSDCATTSTCQQVITVEDTTPPEVACEPRILENASFEEGDFSNWSFYLPNHAQFTVVASNPRSGFTHASIAPTGHISGLWQQLPANPGEFWLGAAHLSHRGVAPLASTQAAWVELQFLDEFEQVIVSGTSLPITADTPPDLYLRAMLEGLAPPGTAYARLRIMANHGLDSSFPTIDVDDAILTPYYAFTFFDCLAPTPVFEPFVSATDNCALSQVVQQPPFLAPLPPGEHLIAITAIDACGQSNVCFTSLTVLDVMPPGIACPPTLFLPDLSSVPPPDPASVNIIGSCSPVTVLHLEDMDNGGQGTAEDPLVITRLYFAIDESGNTNVCSQIISVGGSLPEPPPSDIFNVVLDGSNVLMQTQGTNGWSALPEYSLDLLPAPQSWLPVTGLGVVYTNGTNFIQFAHPNTNLTYLFFRLRQEPN